MNYCAVLNITNKFAFFLWEGMKIKLYILMLVFLQSVKCNDRIERKTKNLIFQVNSHSVYGWMGGVD